jgi:hypothetical protein
MVYAAGDNIQTYRGYLTNIQLNNIEGNFKLNGIQESSTYLNADHTKQKGRLPDMRNLLWRDVNISQEQIKSGLNYYTSDIEGSFKIIARGLNANKEIITGEKMIIVTQQ